MRRLIRLSAIATITVLCHTAYAQTPAKVAEGKRLAVNLCASCHQVTPEQGRPMRVYNAKTHSDEAAPTFQEIASHNGRDARYIGDILDEPHYPMRRRSFNSDEIEALVAYIQSVRP